MKTHDFVELLAADRTIAWPPGRVLGLALVPAISLALVVFLAWLGVRDDIVVALGNPRFVFKLLINLTLVAVSAGLLLRLSRPGRSAGLWGMATWLVPAALALAVAIELSVLPSSQWESVALGQNSTWCLRVIPALALAPLLASLWSLRRAAASRPALTGAVAGLMSAGVAGAMYATHCPDDSPLFVAIWYVIATALVAVLGAVLGSRWLRW